MMTSPAWKPERAAPSPPGKGRGWQIAIVAGLLLALGGAVLGWLLFPDPFTRPRFLPLGIYEYASPLPPRPWARQDIESLEALDWAKSSTAHDSQQLRLLRSELEGLAKAPASEPVVLYLGGYLIDHQGKPCLLPANGRLDDPATWLPLADALSLLRLCPARRKLLLFDALSPLVVPGQGLVRSDTAESVWPLLEDCVKQDPSLAILTASAPGQVARASGDLRHSLFVQFVLRGLNGAADGWPRSRPDGRVKLHELAAYVRDATDSWSVGNDGERQTPALLGGATDWPLIIVPSDPSGETAPPRIYPVWLTAGWKKLDGWYSKGLTRSTSPVYVSFARALLDGEERWNAGVDPGRVRSDLEARLGRLEDKYRRVAPAALPPQPPAPAEAEVEELRRLLARRDRLPAGKPPEEMLKPILAAFEAMAKKHQKTPQGALALAAAASQPLSVEGAKLLAPYDPMLEKLAARGMVVPRLWSPEAARLLFLTQHELDRAGHFSEEALTWGKAAADRAAKLRAEAEALAFGSAVPWDKGMVGLLRSCLAAARAARQQRAMAQAAIEARDTATGLLPGYLLSDQFDAGEVSSLRRTVAAAQRLKRLLGDSTTGMAELEDATRAIRQGPDSLQSLLRPLAPEPFRALIGRMKDARPADIRRCRLWLSTPWPTARQRLALWSALRDGSQRRSEVSMEPLGLPGVARPPLPELPAWDERAAQQGGVRLRERDLVRASAAALRLQLVTGADLVEADSLLGKLRRDPKDSASWMKLAAALRRAGASTASP